MTVEELLAIPEAYDRFGYPRKTHWVCQVCGQPLAWMSPPQAMIRAIEKHEKSVKHSRAAAA